MNNLSHSGVHLSGVIGCETYSLVYQIEQYTGDIL